MENGIDRDVRKIYGLVAVGAAMVVVFALLVWSIANKPIFSVIETADRITITWGTLLEPVWYNVRPEDCSERVYSSETGHVWFRDSQILEEHRHGWRTLTDEYRIRQATAILNSGRSFLEEHRSKSTATEK